MSLITYKVCIKLITPFNISTGESLGNYIDKSTVKYKGKPYIPASTIKGKIRSNFYMINELDHNEDNCSCPMCSIFGKPGFSPSNIYVDDFITTDKEPFTVIRFGNAIDRYRKIAKDKALFAEELSANSLFKGEIKVTFDHETIKYKDKLEMAIKMIDSIGNGKSRGHGHVEIHIEEVN